MKMWINYLYEENCPENASRHDHDEKKLTQNWFFVTKTTYSWTKVRELKVLVMEV